MLEDVLDGLFHIAKADGLVHDRELDYLHRVATIFGFGEAEFARIRARHVKLASDPYAVIGVDPDAPLAEIRKRYRALVAESHPDRMMARGVPAECQKIASERTAALNAAWEEIRRMRSA